MRMAMNSPDQNALPDSVENRVPPAMTLPVLDVLERLSRGDSLDMILSSTGLAASDLRACFHVAASTFRNAHGVTKATRAKCDPATMSLAEALDALAAFGMKGSSGTG